MISVLVVDDNASKLRRLVGVVDGALASHPHEVDQCSNLIATRNALVNKQYDLLIIDLVLPNREDEDPVENLGPEFIREIPLVQSYYKPKTIIGVTAYPDIFQTYRHAFDDGLWYLLSYDETSTDWERRLTARLKYLVASLESEQSGSEYKSDVAIVTALMNPELLAVLQSFGLSDEVLFDNDETIYYQGEVPGKSQVLRIHAACARQMGMTGTCALTMKVIEHFRPRFVVMSGISAGISKAKTGLGDVLVCDESWNYDSGKRVTDEGKSQLQPDPRHLGLDRSIFPRLQQFVGKQSFMKEIESAWVGKRPGTPLKSHLGPVVSGSAVVADPAIPAAIKTVARTVLGLEMETYGLMYAAENCVNPKPIALSVKSVCDYADNEKCDDFQRYAAFTSAEYLRKLVSVGIFDRDVK